VRNGVGMLVHQAALQITRWTGMEVPVEFMWRVVADEADEAGEARDAPTS
jgi:shikimate 5-dehydrogenase